MEAMAPASLHNHYTWPLSTNSSPSIALSPPPSYAVASLVKRDVPAGGLTARRNTTTESTRETSHGMSRAGPPDLRIHRLREITAWWAKWLGKM